ILQFVERPDLHAEMVAAFASQGSNPNALGSPHNQVRSRIVPLYRCPADDRQYLGLVSGSTTIALTGYVGVNGQDLRSRDGVLYWNSRVTITDITDGTSNTLTAGERPPSHDLQGGWWYTGTGQPDPAFSPRRNTGSADVTLG